VGPMVDRVASVVITTEALAAQLEMYLGWRYSPGDPRYPHPLPGVRLPRSPPAQTNCCAFVEGVAVGAAVRSGIGVPWGLAAHQRAMLQDPDHRQSPVEVLVDAGIADRWPDDRVPPPWSVCQGWRGHRGHTFLIADVQVDRVLILEANRGYGLDGVGWRGHGMATNIEPPAMWHRDPRAWTWGRVRETYPELAVASLQVDRTDPDGDLEDLESLPEPFIPGKPEGGGSVRG